MQLVNADESYSSDNDLISVDNPFKKPFCSLLRETTQVWLLQLCLPSLTESGGIDGLRQFGTLISHTLVQWFSTGGEFPTRGEFCIFEGGIFLNVIECFRINGNSL